MLNDFAYCVTTFSGFLHGFRVPGFEKVLEARQTNFVLMRKAPFKQRYFFLLKKL
jgi:hypothetical protein